MQLVGGAEHHLGRLERGHPQRERVADRLGQARLDRPQRVPGQHFGPAAFHLGVGELELHALEGGKALAELLA